MDSKSSQGSNADMEDIKPSKDFEINNFDEKIKNQGDLRIVLPGDHIGEGFIAGHGTYENPKDNQIYASMAGVIH